jgi:SWI/SNF-related matrix-associated actin-dependent regulator 1 of chromatin subfamily A
VGAKNKKELFARLRGSGFMLRRLKKDVLKDLPPKRYKMVVFPKNSTTTKIIDKESAFNFQEIITHGAPVGTVLPELRREMGIAKIDDAARYIIDLLEGGVKKIGVFAHHRDVCHGLELKLKAYNPVKYIGGLSDRMKMVAESAFQNEPACRVFIGNEAAEEGITLTAAHNVVDVEPEWVPGKSDQRYDRFHRITQTESVMVHILVVEGSLDAKILGSAANKKKDSKEVLDGQN